MIFHVMCYDKPNSLELRMQTREEHLKYLDALGSKLKLAGPMLDLEGKAKGTIAIFECENNELEEILSSDPYAKAELFNRVDIETYNPLFGTFKK